MGNWNGEGMGREWGGGGQFTSNLGPEVGKVTLKSNGDEALSVESLIKSNGDEALNDDPL
jgi:hypothetical protein